MSTFSLLLVTAIACLTACALLVSSRFLFDYALFLMLLLLMGFCCLAALLFLLRFSRALLPEVFVYTLMIFFLMSAWGFGVATWLLDHRLPENLENKLLYVEGEVISLPKHYSGNGSGLEQVFDFKVDTLRVCLDDALHFEECQPYTSEKRKLPERFLQVPGSHWLWLKLFPEAGPAKIKLSLYRGTDIETVNGGQRYRLLVKLKRPRSSLNFSGFDYETWLFSNGYHAKGYVRSSSDNQLLGVNKKSLSFIRDNIRQTYLRNSTPRNAESSEEEVFGEQQALILALSLGDRSLLTATTKKILQKSGTAHLLAISGMHIGLISVFAFIFSRSLFRASFLVYRLFFRKQLVLITRFPDLPEKLAAFFSLLFATVYALLAGFTLPTQRALVMVICYCLAMMFARSVNFYSVLLFSMLLVLLLDPFALLNPGFYLSFSAVFIIQWALLNRHDVNKLDMNRNELNISGRDKEPSVRKLINRQDIGRAVRGQFAAFLGLVPLTILLFGAFSPLAFFANLLAIPLVSFFILPLSLVHTALAFANWQLVSLCQAVLFPVIDFLLGFLDSMNHLSAGMFSGEIIFDSLISVLLFLAVVLMLSPLPLYLKSMAWVLFLFSGLYIWADEVKRQVPEKEFRLSVLDVGQGLAVYIETTKHRLLYDTGPGFGDAYNSGEMIVYPALRDRHSIFRGANELDLLLLSHGDRDHVGGASFLLKEYPVAQVLGYPLELYKKPVAKIESEVPRSNCESGQHWEWDGVQFEVLWPLDSDNLAFEKSNNHSCVLKVTAASGSVLLPGDIEASVERRLSAYYSEVELNKKIDSDLLLAAHHGSKTSNGSAFINKVSPEFVLVSAGYRHHFGHPHPSVVDRFSNRGIEVLNTADHGEMVFESWKSRNGEKQAAFSFARLSKQRFWRF